MIITYMQIIMLASHQLPRDRKEERKKRSIEMQQSGSWTDAHQVCR